MRHKVATCLVLVAAAAGTFVVHPARAQGQAPSAHQHDQQKDASEQAPDAQKRPPEHQHDMNNMAGTRDIPLMQNVQTGIGANVTAYAIDSALKPFYGDRPWGINMFIRFRLKPGA